MVLETKLEEKIEKSKLARVKVGTQHHYFVGTSYDAICADAKRIFPRKKIEVTPTFEHDLPELYHGSLVNVKMTIIPSWDFKDHTYMLMKEYTGQPIKQESRPLATTVWQYDEFGRLTTYDSVEKLIEEMVETSDGRIKKC